MLGTWISTQQDICKNKERLMKNTKIYNKCAEILSEYQECLLDNKLYR